jgi:hypothetical protein
MEFFMMLYAKFIGNALPILRTHIKSVGGISKRGERVISHDYAFSFFNLGYSLFFVTQGFAKNSYCASYSPRGYWHIPLVQ